MSVKDATTSFSHYFFNFYPEPIQMCEHGYYSKVYAYIQFFLFWQFYDK